MSITKTALQVSASLGHDDAVLSFVSVRDCFAACDWVWGPASSTKQSFNLLSEKFFKFLSGLLFACVVALKGFVSVADNCGCASEVIINFITLCLRKSFGCFSVPKRKFLMERTSARKN